ncbi:flagellin [Clostridium botulinum]|uniref:flagellin N-terminal helical domain-containing protein n=1 Tax=Clostridium botulinum TaxID=1491 RepID=UPI0007742565|nr:flagellin [Clostridium botulinum]MBY6931395.1 flagellin [Clostridium botulinum]NFO80500.1 flagellin [Clostridium botulinum]
MIINHNMNAMNAHRNMGMNTVNSGKSMEKLSSGLRINRAGDDAAGLAISEKMRGQIRGLDQASRNGQDGISMIQTAEGALNETHSILQRMRELGVQAGNDTNTTDDRKEIQKEIQQLTEEVDRIANNTEFNTQKLLNGNKSGDAGSEIDAAVIAKAGVFKVDIGAAIADGDKLSIDGKEITFNATTAGTAKATIEAALDSKYDVTVSGKDITFTQKAGKEIDKAGMNVSLNGTNKVVTTTTEGVSAKEATASEGKASLQVGANKGQTMAVEISDMRASALGITKTDGKGLSVVSSEDANASVEAFDKALNKVSAERSKLGAIQNRLEHTVNNLGTSSENLSAAESRIRDVDMAKEMMNFSKNNILSQAAQAMLAQANQQPQGVLQLLR